MLERFLAPRAPMAYAVLRIVAGLWAVSLGFGVGCAATLHEAVQRDMYENARNQPAGRKAESLNKDEETPWVCPPGRIQTEDCRVLPCKVTCEEPPEPKR